jgi:hypothetical protein
MEKKKQKKTKGLKSLDTLRGKFDVVDSLLFSVVYKKHPDTAN